MRASLTMIDRHYGHLPATGASAIKPVDAFNAPEFEPWTLVDAGWKSKRQRGITSDNKRSSLQAEQRSPITDSNR
jgi:hypothetical protein